MWAGLALKVWCELVHMDLVMWRHGFRALYRLVRETPTRQSLTPNPAALSAVLNALGRACVWYYKTPKCLQRSAVLTRLLRRQGIPAMLVVGCHPEPLRAHAWVEVAGDVVSERIHDLEHFHVLDRW